ncbi:MAG: NADP-dependent oxidoreductase, partial [Terrimesophilobacter sp.]
MTMMRAMVMDGAGGPEVLVERDVPMVTPAIGEAIVRVSAAGINPIDAKTRAGSGAAPLIRNYPAILGVDFCGTIVRPAFDAHPFQPGDEVYGMVSVPRLSGSYAEFLTVPVIAIARKPHSLTPVQAAAVPCAALTAWGCIVTVGAVKSSDRVLIHAAAGGVGHVAVQLAKRAGAHVIATASERNSHWLRELGADEVIDYRSTRFEEATGDIDVVVDLIGNVHDHTGTRSLSVLRPDGLLINVPSGSWPDFRSDAAAAGMRATDIKALSDTATLTAIADLLDSGELTINIDREFPLAQVAEAHRELEKGHTRGKIVLRTAQ